MTARVDEIRFLRWLLREVYPHLARTAPPELVRDVERTLLRVAVDARGGLVTLAPSSSTNH